MGEKRDDAEDPARLHAFVSLEPKQSLELVLSAALVALVIATALHVTFKSISVRTAVDGVVWPRGGITRVTVERPGVIESVRTTRGVRVNRRDVLAVVRHDEAFEDTSKLLQNRIDELAVRLEVARERISSLESGDGAGGPGLSESIRLENELSDAIIDARVRLDTLRSGSQTVIRSPRDGVVTDLRVSAGDEVDAGYPLLTIVDSAPVYSVRAYVPDSLARRVGTDMPVSIEVFDGRSKTNVKKAGVVASVSSFPISPRDADRAPGTDAPLYELWVAFEEGGLPLSEEEGFYEPGVPVTVLITTDSRSVLEWMFSRFRR